jgi:hypothetical protein
MAAAWRLAVVPRGPGRRVAKRQPAELRVARPVPVEQVFAPLGRRAAARSEQGLTRPCRAARSMQLQLWCALLSPHGRGNARPKAGFSADRQEHRPNHHGGSAGQLGDLATAGSAAHEHPKSNADRMQDRGRSNKTKTKQNA